MILKVCKKHGELEEKDCQQRIKLGKYIEISCKICAKERRGNISPEKRLQINERKKLAYQKRIQQEKKPRLSIEFLEGADIKSLAKSKQSYLENKKGQK